MIADTGLQLTEYLKAQLGIIGNTSKPAVKNQLADYLALIDYQKLTVCTRQYRNATVGAAHAYQQVKLLLFGKH